MKIRRLSSVFLFIALFAAADGVDPDSYLEHVKYLSSGELRGRGTGTPELDKAADYIARQFRKIGLRPASGKGYFQKFAVTTNARLGASNEFVYTLEDESTELKLRRQFIPFNFSSRGSYSGEVVFAGYGITAEEYNYDDYTHLDVKDKFVLILKHEPQEYDEKSVFAGKVYTEHAQFYSKAVNAKMHGAKGVILVNDTENHGGNDGELQEFQGTVGPNNAGIPFVQLDADVARKWFKAAGKDLGQVQEDIDEDLQARSFSFPESIKVEIRTDIRRKIKTVRNVLGYLPGETDEYVVVGAHYDHLGLGEQFSMAPSSSGTPHPGADDNASGTAGLIEVARWFASRPKPSRGVLFLAFAGEELGLLGSSHYVNHPILPLDKAVAMLNMDMIGRIRNGKVYLGGVGTGASFRQTLESLLPDDLEVEFSDTTGYGSSDHTSFTTKQVPVLFFFSGLHADYHRPSDTWEKIDAPQAARLLDFVAAVTANLVGEAERPQFVRVTDPHAGRGRPVAGAGGSGYGPYFGSVPDFTEIPEGLRFADVRPDSPADEAGLRGGDILVEFDGKRIENLYDFTYALRSSKPGDHVKVRILREDDSIEATVKLRERE